MEIERALNILAEAHHRITKPRLQILKAVLKMQKPFSAADVLKGLKDQSADLVTIYRNLAAFETAGLICRCDFTDETAQFILSEPGHDHHHHHIICRSCRRVQALEICVLKEQEKALRKLGFTKLQHRIEFSGLCRACS